MNTKYSLNNETVLEIVDKYSFIIVFNHHNVSTLQNFLDLSFVKYYKIFIIDQTLEQKVRIPYSIINYTDWGGSFN